MKLKPALQLFILIIFIFKLSNGQAQIIDSNQKFHPDSLISTISNIEKELSLKHPGYYRYNSKETFDLLIDSIKSTIVDSVNLIEAYQKLKLIISSIHCLHTELRLSEEIVKKINQESNLFPFQLFFDGSRAFVVQNKSNNVAINPGDEILSINGQPIECIRDQLFGLIPADGYNLTMKYRALDLLFPVWYRIIDPSDAFKVEILQNSKILECVVEAKKLDEITEDGFINPPTFDKQLTLKIENKIAYLTIHSFSKSEIKQSNQKFKKFLDEVFNEIKEKDIENLVIDLRDNTGGTDSYAVYLASYFFDEPFRYWDRIEVTGSLAKEVKGLIRLFYKKPVEEDGHYIWQKGKLTKEFDYFEIQKPAKNNFDGNTYLIINGFCMSSCADLAAVLSHNRKVTTVGQETGGGYQGNSSGMIPVTEIEPFGFNLSVPLNNYFNAVDTTVNVGRGTIPDYPVTKNVQSVLAGEDLELSRVKEILESRNRK